ncbi:MAG: hypothetical protein AUJ12_10075 [Alphaproteobacteria bacterium CG1_02_46_17]|nr:MAG: hypothetical protein AUJ12_10075 [Alphaproteobacteria bacterium CG1_02_46_17]
MTDKQKILLLYLIFFGGVVTAYIPNMTVQGYSMLFGLVSLILAYIFRARADEDDLVWHHSTFMIRTIWIWSLFLSLGMIGAGYIVGTQADMSALQNIMDMATSGSIPDEAEMDAAGRAYFDTNFNLILKTTLMWLAPAQVYAVWRIYKGLSRAMNGYRVQNLRNWF